MLAVLMLLYDALRAAADGDASAESALANARESWGGLSEAEREALTPLAKYVTARVRGLATVQAGPAGTNAGDDDDAAYLAHLLASEADQGDNGHLASGPAASPANPPAPKSRPTSSAEPEDLLKQFGLPSFRPGQREAVVAALAGRDSLVVMPTGGGKSLCYQIPAIATDALTVVVSPLIALMRDQCRRLRELGHPAVMLASGEEDENRLALQAIRGGAAQIVFAAPERFASGNFRAALRSRAIALFVVDEAHCVSEWGHDFRPDYLRLRPIIDELGRPPVMACTATATPKVAEEIATRLGLRDPERVRSGFDRPNLSFDVIPVDGKGSEARKHALITGLVSDAARRPAVVYCGTRKSTDGLAEHLQAYGLKAVSYHAGVSPKERADRQDAFMSGKADVVVATNAFGMGVDKADVRTVVHHAMPSSLEAYYQEAGRAGRDGKPAQAVLLASRSDLGRLVQFIRQAEVTPQQVQAIVQSLRSRATNGVVAIESGNGDADRVALAIAERIGAVRIRPGAAGAMEIEVGTTSVDIGAAARVCQEAKDRRWGAYRIIAHYADASVNHVCRRRQLLDHFGDPSKGAPSGRCCDVCDPFNWEASAGVTSPRVSPISTPTPRAARSGSRAATDDGPPVDEGDLARLKQWRLGRASGKPAYTVATDATLREILRHRPRTPDQLLAIRGIGQSFVANHSDSLLHLLALTTT